MQAYYARTRVHVQKLAMAMHFSEKLDMIISLATVQLAVEFLSSIEKRMSAGFNAFGRNPLASVSKDIIRYISNQSAGVSLAELMIQFSYEVQLPELQEILDTLTIMGELGMKDSKYVTT
jgi:hypothetical protein